MTVKKNRFTAIMFVLAITSMLNAYSQNDFVFISGKTMTLDEKNQETVQNIKKCTGVEDIHVIQSKNFDVVMKWGTTEAEGGKRVTTMRLNKETGIYVAMSSPMNEAWNNKKSRKSKEFKEEDAENSAFFAKVQTCLAVEDIRIIETSDKEILEKWIQAEDESRYISTNFNAETGIFTATSTPKSDGNGRVMFKKLD